MRSSDTNTQIVFQNYRLKLFIKTEMKKERKIYFQFCSLLIRHTYSTDFLLVGGPLKHFCLSCVILPCCIPFNILNDLSYDTWNEFSVKKKLYIIKLGNIWMVFNGTIQSHQRYFINTYRVCCLESVENIHWRIYSKPRRHFIITFYSFSTVCTF